MAAHLAFCPSCRRTVNEFESVGGHLVGDVAPEPVEESLFEASLLQRSQKIMISRQPGLADSVDPNPILPEPLRSYLGGDVNSVWRCLSMSRPHRDDGTTARRSEFGCRPVPSHSHGGLELTLVLSGAFSDSTVHTGEVICKWDESIDHQPHAAPGEDCICLAVSDAPLRFKSLGARMVQPLIGI